MNVAAEKFAKKSRREDQQPCENNGFFPPGSWAMTASCSSSVQQGALEMAEISVAPIGSTTLLVTAFQMPFLFNNWDQYLAAMKDPVTENVLKGLEQYQVRGPGGL